jgi:uncharacterized protein (DUF1778 family)
MEKIIKKTNIRKKYKDHSLTFRITSQTYTLLQSAADNAQCSISEILRDAVKKILSDK